MPGWCLGADGFLEGRFAAKVGGAISRVLGIGIDPLRVMPSVIAAVVLVIAVNPAAQDHQFHGCQQLGVVVLTVFWMVALGQQGQYSALGTAQAQRRQVGPVVIALVTTPERGELGYERASQFLAREFLIGSVVIKSGFTG